MQTEDLENRFKFHPAKDDNTRDAHTSVRNACKEFSLFLNDVVPEGREKSLAITHLEEVMMWANAGIARNS